MAGIFQKLDGQFMVDPQLGPWKISEQIFVSGIDELINDLIRDRQL